MNYLLKVLKLSLILSLGLFAGSCSDLDELNADSGVVAENLVNGGDCFELVFPLTIILPDESEISVQSKEEIKEAKQAFKDENPDVRGRINFVYPLEVVNAEGETITVNSQEELKELKQACRGERGQKSKCFELVYPVTYALEDGATVTGESRGEIRAALKAWKEENLDATEKPSLQFPIEIINSDGETVSVEDAAALQVIKDDCPQRPGRRGGRG